MCARDTEDGSRATRSAGRRARRACCSMAASSFARSLPRALCSSRALRFLGCISAAFLANPTVTPSYCMVAHRIIRYRILCYRIVSSAIIMTYAMPCHAMPCRAMPCHAMPCHAMPCHAMPYHAMPCHATPCHATPYHAIAAHPVPSSPIPFCNAAMPQCVRNTVDSTSQKRLTRVTQQCDTLQHKVTACRETTWTAHFCMAKSSSSFWSERFFSSASSASGGVSLQRLYRGAREAAGPSFGATSVGAVGE